MSSDQTGRVALVTGAGKRLGQAFARALAGRGFTLALHYNASRDGAEALRTEIVAAGGRAECFGADLGSAHAARALAGRVVDTFGRLDVLVNSAAVMHQVQFESTVPELYDEVLNLNLRAPFFVAQGAAGALRSARGVVINMADLGGIQPWPGFAAHSLSKAGVVMLTKVLALSLAPDVRVNAIAPGAVLVPESFTPGERERLARDTPLKRLGDPKDAVGVLLFLIESEFVTGEVILVDGGRHLR